MSDESNQELLRQIVKKHSQVSDNWDIAKTEWKLLTIFDKHDSHCICKHKIVENCVIQNKFNKNELIVGNVCINHFNEEELKVSPSCRKSLRLLIKKVKKHIISKSLIKLAVKQNILSIKEQNHYLKTIKKVKHHRRMKKKGKISNLDKVHKDFFCKINILVRLGFRSDRKRCHCGLYAKPRQNSLNKSYFYSCYNYTPSNKYNHCNFTLNAPKI